MSDSIRKKRFTAIGDITYIALRDFSTSDRKFKKGDIVTGLPKRRLRRLYRRNLGMKHDPYTQAVLDGKGRTLGNGTISSFVKKEYVKNLVQKVKDIVTFQVTAKSKKSDLVKYAEQNGIVVDPEATNKVIWETIQEKK